MISGTVVVSGTGTDIGKTVVTAAVAANARDVSVAVVKPGQSGVVPGEPGDVDEVRRLSGVEDVHELARYRDPLSPEAGAQREGRAPLTLDDVADAVRKTAGRCDLVLVEGSGGLLVRFGAWTVADLARALDAPVLLVTTASTGTLNTTTLALEALRRRDVACAGVVVGAWPGEPDLVARSNLADLTAIAGEPLAGVLPDRAASAPCFRDIARAGLGPRLGGYFDAGAFIRQHGDTRRTQL
ncbi:dethiobiotin synthase [Amycolatopsis sp. cmx-4-68]|uniref:dethiobiotin synthase n=1 Tax=Amycolatopsis sp. cmx-4-68 TaxID=2790938 RepID=UPI0039784E0C